MSPAEPDREETGVRLEATASGQATVNQAGRDQHIHFSTGIRRAIPGADDTDLGCPYPGLASFTGGQAAWFFGRDKLTAALVSRLDGCLTGGGPVMVVAASGAGKSSLLRAGLLPKVAGGALTPAGSRHWPQVVFTPGAHPLRQAAAALAAACSDGGAIPADPGADNLDFLLVRAAEAAGPGAHVILVVDQFEELFRLCEDEDERSAFISWLCQAARGEGPGGLAAFTACAVRADFYLDCTRYPQLSQALQDNQVIVGAMSPAELREAITCPAEAAGLDIEPGLTELLLTDLRAGPPAGGNGSLAADDGAGRLPLLAHALRATWQQRHGSTLTVAGYRDTGGIEHAITETAEHVYGRLGAAARQETRSLFLRLVKIGGAGGEDVRRPVPRSALAAAGSTAAEVTDAYTASRLLTQTRDTVQITHEALLRAWPRLAAWLDEDRAGQLIRQQAEDDAGEWELTGRDPSLLYRGTRLGAAAAWAGSHTPGLTPAARHFLAASRRRARRTAVTIRAGVAALAVLALATSIISVVALGQRSAAISQRNLAVYNQVLAKAGQLTSSDPAAAAQLLAAAYRMRPSSALQSRLIATENQPLPALTRTSSAVYSVAASPDGRVIVTTSDGNITLWNDVGLGRPQQAGKPPVAGAGIFFDAVAVSPDGQTLAGGDDDGSIWLWDIARPAHPRALGPPVSTGKNFYTSQVAFSPDGRILASADLNRSRDGGSITLWDATRPGHPRELSRLAVTRATASGLAGNGSLMAFSPGGSTLADFTSAGTGQGSVVLWDIRDPSHPRELGRAASTGRAGVTSAAFSPDGRTLASGSTDGTVTLWDITRPQHPRLSSPPLSAGSGTVISADFSPDGRILTAVSQDGTVLRWDTTSPADPQLLGLPASTGNTAVYAAAFSRDGQDVVTGSYNGTISVSPPSGPATVETQPSSGPSAVYALSPDGKVLASAGTSRVSLWDVSDLARPRQVSQLKIPGGSPASLAAFSPDGRTLAVGSGSGSSGTVTLWDVTDPARPQQAGSPLNDYGTGADSAAFSPSGHLLATGSNDGAITLWDLTDPAHPRQVVQFAGPGTGAVNDSLAFSPDGRMLAGGDTFGTITLWAATGSHQELAIVPLPSGAAVQSVGFSPDGRALAVGVPSYANGPVTITLWDVSDPALPHQVGRPLEYGATAMTSSPGSRDIAIAAQDGTIALWDIVDPAHPRQAGPLLTSAGAILTSAQFSPQSHVLATASDDETIQLWDLDTSYALSRICTTTAMTPQLWHQYLPQVPYQPPCQQ